MSKRDPNLVNSWSKLWSLFPKYFSSLFRGCNAKKRTTWKSAAGVRKLGVAKGFSFSGNGMLFWTAEPKRRFGEIPLWRFLPTPSLWVTRSFQNLNISEKNYFCFTCVLQTLLFFFSLTAYFLQMGILHYLEETNWHLNIKIIWDYPKCTCCMEHIGLLRAAYWHLEPLNYML